MGLLRRGEAADCLLGDSRQREHRVNFRVHVPGIKTDRLIDSYRTY